MDINTLESLPPETLVNILKNTINMENPDEILRVSNISTYLRNVLRSSIEKLETNEDLLYLDIGWLTQYPRLKEVSDNIIFTIDVSNLKEIQIPRYLIKFNVRIHVPLNFNIDAYNEDTFFRYLLESLKHTRLDNYTVRFIHQFDIEPKYNFTLIIDRGKIAKLTNYTKRNVLFPAANVPTLDYRRLFEEEMNIKLIDTNDSNDMIYYNSAKDDEMMFLEYHDLDLGKVLYPIQLFKNYFNDITISINQNINELDNEDIFMIVQSIQYYNETGYIEKGMIKWMTDFYLEIHNLFIRVIAGGNVRGHLEVQLNDILRQYFTENNMRMNRMRFSTDVERFFIYRDKNINPAHFYLEESYFKLINHAD